VTTQATNAAIPMTAILMAKFSLQYQVLLARYGTARGRDGLKVWVSLAIGRC
jgi:hypothetical protein